ncbi:MAG: hypothetical protein HOY69_36690, partial [Streptomyces sp.]|nr:hypothetical protein [Streptomyces sp.]
DRLAGGNVVHGGEAGGVRRMRVARVLAALLLALPGEGVHLVTPDDESARADAAAARGLLGPLRATVGALRAGMTPEQARAAYAADVTVGAYDHFGHHLLRGLRTLDGADRAHRPARAAVVCDTAHVLIANLNRLVVLVERVPTSTSRLHSAAVLAARLEDGRDYTVSADRLLPRFTAPGRDRLHEHFGVTDPGSVETLLQEKAVAEAVLARLVRRGEDYDVDDGRVVRLAAGGLPADVSFTGGLRQAIEVREDVPVTATDWAVAKTGVWSFFAGYRVVGGTAHGDFLMADHLAELFGLDVWDRRTPQEAGTERARSDEAADHLRTGRDLARWTALGSRHRAAFHRLRARLQDPAQLAPVVAELTGLPVTGDEQELREDLWFELDVAQGDYNVAEAYGQEAYWPDALDEHERILTAANDRIWADLRRELTAALGVAEPSAP